MTNKHAPAQARRARILAWRESGLTFQAIADKLGCSRQRVQQIFKREPGPRARAGRGES
jgi:DNA-binding CsgD family transcriptional regulator